MFEDMQIAVLTARHSLIGFSVGMRTYAGGERMPVGDERLAVRVRPGMFLTEAT